MSVRLARPSRRVTTGRKAAARCRFSGIAAETTRPPVSLSFSPPRVFRRLPRSWSSPTDMMRPGVRSARFRVVSGKQLQRCSGQRAPRDSRARPAGGRSARLAGLATSFDPLPAPGRRRRAGSDGRTVYAVGARPAAARPRARAAGPTARQPRVRVCRPHPCGHRAGRRAARGPAPGAVRADRATSPSRPVGGFSGRSAPREAQARRCTSASVRGDYEDSLAA